MRNAKHATQSTALERYIVGPARSVASLLGVPIDDVESEVLSGIRGGAQPDVALDRIVLEAVR
jgi:hypothetical protein